MKFQNTKQLRQNYISYLRVNNGGNLFHFYKSFSDEKFNALVNCKKYADKLDGKNFQIISANGWAFSVGFTFTDESGKNAFCLITKDNTRYMHI